MPYPVPTPALWGRRSSTWAVGTHSTCERRGVCKQHGGWSDHCLLFLCLCRLLQLQHHPATTPSCQLAPPPPPAPLVFPACDGLLTSGLPLLPAPLLQAGISPVVSAARLLDTHLHISASPAALPTTSLPPRLTLLAPGCDPVGLPLGDCEMEDLTSGQLGTFVLVQ